MNTHTHTVPSLAGYAIVEQLYKGSRTEVYRALQTEPQQPVVIKVLRHQHPSFTELVQFRNQYAIARHLNHPAIVCPLALERCGNGYALVMPEEGFISLATYTQQHPLDLSTILAIAIQLTEVLHYLINQRIIHKDIKPGNILIHPETRQIKLIDFSIASLLPKEQQQLVNPNILEGTLAYISPEQTGRMNRGIDYRTDFYSLGVTLFELLTGELPFPTDDPMELVHCHIAKMPAAIGNGEKIPEVVSNIVMKLMAKNAEDRYQSALGLKHDLERCLRQWKETGDITPFELGARDISDRFLIPEKLYGRQQEVQTLLNAFDRVASPPQSPLKKGGGSELMLVAGFSGIGKTAVVNEVHKPITRQKGYFIQGKFDQFNRNVPFSAFVQALRDLMGQLLSESDTQLQQWKSQILDAVGENGQVIIEVIPELERIIGQQPPAPELSGTAAQNRFNLLFSKFIQVFTTKEHPLVIFLDDLQWADSASLNLIKLLMSEASSSYLLMMGAYRDNEVFPAHPLMLTLDEINKVNAAINTITLAPLSVTHINRLVADTLSCDGEVAKPLTELLYQKTKGNPFFTTQFLLGLYGEELIQFNREVGHWECDITQVRQRALTDDVVEFMALQLQKLPSETQALLKLAACIGNPFDLQTLSIVSQQAQTEVAAALWKALQEGLILPITETYKFFQDADTELSAQVINVPYKFLHDRVQQAAYSLIPEDRKPITHVRIGRLLLENTAPEAREERIFELVGQLNYGIDTIARAEEREELAHLNLRACRKAKNATAYRAGREYACNGLSLLGNNPWQEQYEMTLALNELATEFAALCGEWEEMDRLVEEVVANSHSLVERANVYRIQIQANVSRNQPTEAIKIALGFLQQLGVTFPENPTETDIGKAIAAVQELMAEREVEDLLNLPEMRDEEKIAIVQTANSIVPAAYMCNPLLFPLVVCLSVCLSIQYGNIPPSSYAYVSYGVILSSSANPDVITGDRFCRLALQLVDKLDAKIDKTAVLVASGLLLIHRTSPLRETLPLLQAAYTNGLETGSYEFAGYGGHGFCFSSFWCNRPLAALAEETRAYCHGLAQLNQLTAANYARLYWQVMLNCLDQEENPTLLSGEAMEEREALLQWQAANDGCGLWSFHTYKLMLCYLFGELESARNHGIEARRYLMAGAGFVFEPAFYFYDSLTMLASLNSNSEEITQVFEKVQQNQRILQEQWAKYAPMNYQHKVDLIEAEKYRMLSQKSEAIELYERAIAGAKANQYIQEEALANELAAKFYLDWGFDTAQPNGKEKIAATYMQEAYYCYARWGAKAKTDHLEANYPQLLRPILQKTSQTLDPLLTLASISPSKSTVCSTSTGTQTSTSNANTTLDLVTILKASQAISSTIDLEELLTQLTQILLHNSGGDRCAIILCEPNQEMQLRAIRLSPRYANATVDATDLSSVNLKDASHLPVKLIQYVKNSREMVVMDSPECKIPIVDHDLTERQPASVLCLPLVDRTQLRGVLYLENQATSGVFHPDRLASLQLLATQAAIALENARLYQQSQDYAQRLEESQLQLVQSEKMSALGNLVAGVAHEINNPLGFINGNITEVRNCVNDITECLQSYRQAFPEPGEEIEGLLEEVEIDFLIEDLPKMLDSMKVGCDRIRGISTSLRMFSRADTESKFKANVHDGIDSTLLILKYRLKAKDFRPEIEVIRNYGDLPEINCFPGQLNQVFMNLLANAIDMFDEMAEGQSFKELQAHPQQITIQTQVVETDHVEICIRDNGKGMSEEICSKIFDRKFTTKAVGKGTGLGLAIARQVIVEKHSGSLKVRSEIAQGTEFIICLPT